MAFQSTSAAVANYNSKLTQIGVRSVVISVGTMTAATVLVALVFNILRPSNKLVYATRVNYASKTDEEVAKESFFSWIPTLFHTDEDTLLATLGLDSVVMIRFLRMLSWMMSVVAVICAGVLIPINVLYNLNNVEESKRSALAMLTIQDVRGNILFVHIGISYLVNLIILGIIWHNYRKITILRAKFFRSPQYLNQLYSRTLSIIRIPDSRQSDQKFSNLVKSLSLPNPATSAQIGRDIGNLPKSIEEHNEAVVKLEKVLAKYLKGGKLANKRPTLKVGGHYLYGIGFGGRKVDSIDYLTEEVKRLENDVDNKRDQLDREDSTATNYGFVTMGASNLAHQNAKYVEKKSSKLKPLLEGAKVSLAPAPEDIIWENIKMTEKQQNPKQLGAKVLLFITCAFWTLPVLVISFLANLTTISTFIPGLTIWQEKSIGTFSAVSGLLPPITSAVFAMLIPIIIRFISKLQGISTKTELSRVVCSRYFDFLFVSQLIIFSLISVLFNLCVSVILQIGSGQSLKSIFQNLSSIPGTISSTYLTESTYWITFAPARGFSAVFDLAQLINLVTITVQSKLTGKRRTPREIREWSKPKSFPFEIYTANLLFIVAVGLSYAVLAPLVIVAVAIVLWVWYLVYKYQLMFIFITEVESGGRLWPIMVNRFLVALCFANLLLALTVALARSWIYFVVLAPPTAFIIFFKIYLNLVYSDKFLYFITKDKEEKLASHTADARKGRLRRYEHPALHEELFVVMVDKNLEHLLPDVFGRTEATAPIQEGTQILATNLVDGLKIASVEESQLEYHEALDYSESRADLSDDEDIGGLDIEEVLRRRTEKAKRVIENLTHGNLISIPFKKSASRNQ